MVRPATSLLLAGVAAGAGTAVYGWAWERKDFVLRRHTVPALAPGARPLTVLHVSDLHLTPGQPWKVEWLRSLASLAPDLVVNTGDNLAHPEAVPVVLDALGPLLDRPGAFVPGSNDWFAPVAKNPARYLLPDRGERLHGDRLPWADLRTAFTGAGWFDATHHRTTIEAGDLLVELAGVSDAHHKADHYDRIAGATSPVADVSIGLTHSPEPRVVNAFADDGFGLVVAGHTHGGQLRIPGYGALVTNCGLHRSMARGLFAWRGGPTWLNVSAGIGTSPYAPVRVACRPEASLLTLVAR